MSITCSSARRCRCSSRAASTTCSGGTSGSATARGVGSALAARRAAPARLDLEDWPAFGRSFDALVDAARRDRASDGRPAGDDLGAVRRHPLQLPRRDPLPAELAKCREPRASARAARRSATRCAGPRRRRCVSAHRDRPSRSVAPPPTRRTQAAGRVVGDRLGPGVRELRRPVVVRRSAASCSCCRRARTTTGRPPFDEVIEIDLVAGRHGAATPDE